MHEQSDLSKLTNSETIKGVFFGGKGENMLMTKQGIHASFAHSFQYSEHARKDNFLIEGVSLS